MPLQPQVIDIDMGLGLDTFTDPKRVVPGKFTTLENTRFRRGKRLEMRRGNVAFGETYKLGNTGSATNTFNAFSNRLSIKKVARDRSGLLYSEYQAANGHNNGHRYFAPYLDKSTALERVSGIAEDVSGSNRVSCAARLRGVPITRGRRSGSVQGALDSVVLGTHTLIVYSEYNGLTFDHVLELRDAGGNVALSSRNFHSSAGTGNCKVLAVSSTKAWIFVPQSATLVRLFIFDLSSLSLSTSADYSVATSMGIDAVVFGSDVFVAGHDFDGGTGIVVKSAPTSWSTPSTFTAKNSYSLGGATFESVAIATPKSTATKIRVLYHDATNGLRGVSLTASTGVTVAGPTTLTGYLAGNPVRKLAAVELGDNAIWIALGHHVTAGPQEADFTAVYGSRETGAWGSLFYGGYAEGLLVSKMNRRTSTDTASFWTWYCDDNATESAFFQWQVDMPTGSLAGATTLAGKIYSGRAAYYNWSNHGVAAISDLDTNTEQLALFDSFRQLPTESGSLPEVLVGVALATANYDTRALLLGHRSGGVYLCSGGLPTIWDGRRMRPLGHPIRPRIDSHSTSGLGGSMSNGTYSVVLVYEFTDEAGNVYQSAPSDPYSITLSGGTSTQSFTVQNTAPFPFDVYGSGRVVMYSTANGLQLYYRATDDVYIATSSSAIRSCSDANLVLRDKLYTTGGVLPNAMPDFGGVVGLFNDRLLFSCSTDDGVIYTEKPASPGFGPEFSDELSIPISPAGGPVTAIVESIDKCVVFKASTIQVFTGEGFTANGAGGGYSPAETIHETIGCPGAWAAVSTKLGIMFDTGGQGIWLLDRGLQLVFVGEAVDAYRDDEVQSSVVVASEDEVRFLLASGVTLCFNLDRNTWSVTTPTPCWDIGYVNGQALWLRKSESGLGGVYRDDDDTFTDAMNGVADTSAAAIQMQAITGWMSFAGIQGYQRVWRALFTGDYGDVHNLLIDAAYDYQDTYADSFVLSSASIGQPYDGQVWMKRGFSKAVRFKLRASSSAGDTVGPMSLTGLSFEVGLLPRAARMKSSKGA